MPVQTEFNTPLTVIKSKGYFVWKDLLMNVKKWYESEYYDFAETKHKYKPEEREVEVSGDRKLNEYVKYRIKVAMGVSGLKDVELIKEGKKINVQEGRVTVHISGTMFLDWQSRFKGNKFLQAIQDFYHKYIIKQKIESEWLDHLGFKMYQLSKMVNQTLGTSKEGD